MTTSLTHVSALAGPLYVVTAVLVVAGGAKLLSPTATATTLRTIGVPKPNAATRLMGLAEIAVGIGAIVTGSALLWAAVALAYASFAAFILWALQADADIGSCGCFGHEDTPPTPGHAAFNAAAAAIAALAAADPVRIGDFDGSLAEGILFAALVATGTALSVLALTTLPRVIALARGTAAPQTPTFAVRATGSQKGLS
jgi:uncharacterized membrane protein YphA (DoxX/SURF4 family)